MAKAEWLSKHGFSGIASADHPDSISWARRDRCL